MKFSIIAALPGLIEFAEQEFSGQSGAGQSKTNLILSLLQGGLNAAAAGLGIDPTALEADVKNLISDIVSLKNKLGWGTHPAPVTPPIATGVATLAVNAKQTPNPPPAAAASGSAAAQASSAQAQQGSGQPASSASSNGTSSAVSLTA